MKKYSKYTHVIHLPPPPPPHSRNQTHDLPVTDWTVSPLSYR